jgi:hypothetical protein
VARPSKYQVNIQLESKAAALRVLEFVYSDQIDGQGSWLELARFGLQNDWDNLAIYVVKQHLSKYLKIENVTQTLLSLLPLQEQYKRDYLAQAISACTMFVHH